MWRPERSLHGPDQATIRDIEPLNRLFTESFTDRYARDGLTGVRVPPLSTAVWRYAIEDAGEGAMLWRDADGMLVAFNMVHRAGHEGWMGPIAVRPDRQGGGVGRAVVQAGIDWLKSQDAAVIGLETMPRTVDNIGFYSRLGFVPAHLTVTMVREAVRQPVRDTERLSRGNTGALVKECAMLARTVAPGTDFTAQVLLTLELGAGDVTLVRQGGELTGFALWHSLPLASGRPKDELRVLKLVARDLRTLEGLVDGLQADAVGERLRRVAVRCQTAYTDAYLHLVARGFRAHWTDLRMTLPTHAEVSPRGTGVVLSNWEI
jgi:GNAT superfamily N-acetyltransferase